MAFYTIFARTIQEHTLSMFRFFLQKTRRNYSALCPDIFLLIHSSKSDLRYLMTLPSLTNGNSYLFVIRQTASVFILTPIYTAASRGVIRPEGAILQVSLTGMASLMFFLPNKKEKTKKNAFPPFAHFKRFRNTLRKFCRC